MNSLPLASDWREIRRLHNELCDPFVMMPMESTAKSLNEALQNIDTLCSEYSYNIARKYWDVPTELLHEEKGLFIGNVFVLAQVAIVQAVAIFQRLREFSGNCNAFPKKKDAILSFQSEITNNSNLSQIVVIEATANYFKHQYKWPNCWNTIESSGVQATTIRIAKSIGMVPGDLTVNMERSLKDLGISDDLELIVNIVSAWRENLANQFLRDSKIANSICNN